MGWYRREFYDKRMNQEVVGDVLGDEFKGYIFKISGGNDKQGFPMKQGIMTAKRVRLLLKKGSSCYRQRRKGERKRKSVRGCIVSADIQVLNLVIVRKGEGELPGLTEEAVPRRLGPKRATRIRKLFALDKADKMEKQYRLKREVSRGEGKKPTIKAPKIQRLVTPQRLQVLLFSFLSRARSLLCVSLSRALSVVCPPWSSLFLSLSHRESSARSFGSRGGTTLRMSSKDEKREGGEGKGRRYT